jgi:MFS family permease
MKQIELGLKQNWKQFTLLVIVNGFVGGMVGMERSILPEIAEEVFHLAATTAILSFIVVFGFTKAITNYFTGALANRFGRKRLLVFGWIVSIPIPFLLMYAESWSWIIVANVLLGIGQGLTWSSTVVMKIDLVGEKQRGLAMGFNEFAGYLSVALVAFFTSWIASEYGIRPYPFYTGVVLIALGLGASIFLVKDTIHHINQEKTSNVVPALKNVFWDTTWRNKNLGSVTQAGLVNNLNDGMVWGIFPILLASKGFDLSQIGIVTATYPAVWGLLQLVTGAMADRYSKKVLLYAGMAIQAVALFALVWTQRLEMFVVLSALIGAGTALVYPTFLATVAENTNPDDRAKSIGVFRLWRDMGYAIGALLTGIIADLWNVEAAIFFIASLTLLSAIILFFRMKDGCEKLSPQRLSNYKWS